MARPPLEPMLAAPTDSPRLPPGCAAEPKWDGFRSLLAREPGLRPRLISRRGTDLSPAFPEITEAAAALPTALGEVIFDGELVIWNAGRLDFRLLLRRHGRTARLVRELAAAHPAHFIAFDVLQLADRDLAREPYRARRGILEAVFAEQELGPLFTLCPSSTDPEEIDLWLTAWAEIGIEGLCFKRLDQPYLPGRRGWTKYRLHGSLDVVLGAVTGSLQRPEILHLGTPGPDQALRYLGRTTPIPARAARELAAYLAPATPEHPWHGLRPTPAFDPAADHPAVLVDPTLVVEVTADASIDSRGRWRQPAQLLRPRPDLAADELPRPESSRTRLTRAD